MKTNHTPGPWTVEVTRSATRLYVEVVNVALDVAIADLHLSDRENMSVDDSDPGPTTMANANLLAAAPEMLSLLIHLCSEIRSVERDAILFEARGVITKATGGAK